MEDHSRSEIVEDAPGGYGAENFFRDLNGASGEDLGQPGRNHTSMRARKLHVLGAAGSEEEIGEQEEGGSKNFFENGSGYGGEGDGEFEWIE